VTFSVSGGPVRQGPFQALGLLGAGELLPLSTVTANHPAAITATGAEGARFRSLCDIILGVSSDAAHEHLEELMGITYKSKFVDGWYQQGRAAGEAKGKAEGIAEGEARGAARTRAEGILVILKSRGLEPTRAERELIESCDDRARLHIWFDRAITVASVAMLVED
jgi:hypothetical protein